MKIIDLHCDTIAEIQAGANILTGNPSGHIDIPRLKQGNVGIQVFASFISSVLPNDRAWDEANKMTDLSVQICETFADNLVKVEISSQIKDLMTSNKIGILLAIENGHAINNIITNLEKLRRKGVRYMTLTHSKNLDWAVSSGEEKCDFDGLTDFGVKVVHAMNELGMIVDVSHVHESTFWDVVKSSKKPFIASHSNSAAICPITRNLKDDQIKAIADSGGMVGINFFPGFLDKEYYTNLVSKCGDLFEMFDEIELKYMDNPLEKMNGMHHYYGDLNKRMNKVNVGIEKIIDHIEYIIKLVGADFVGFGSDFDGVPTLPNGITGCDDFGKIIGLMQDRGFPDETINKITSENFIRVLRENE